ncbi:MAG: AAA family ATPase [Clostridiales bacterium]|nr:AAA family ATPase [Clostridiales bacterium]
MQKVTDKANRYNKLILLHGEPNDDIVRCHYDRAMKKQAVYFRGKDAPYYYYYNNVKWLTNPVVLDNHRYKFFTSSGEAIHGVETALKFVDGNNTYLRIFTSDGRYRSYNMADLVIQENAIKDRNTTSLLDYYKQVANLTGLEHKYGGNILKNSFDRMQFVDRYSVLANYLNKHQAISRAMAPNEVVIYPFGSNISQLKAVNDAMANQVSIIEGPPGTGKTQTILNIIANALIRNKTVAVVSNNNSATDNVFEKLKSHGLGYIAAQLGNAANRENFIINKQQPYPNFAMDILTAREQEELANSINSDRVSLVKIFEMQNRLAKLRQDLTSFKTEQRYFDEYFDSFYKPDPILDGLTFKTSDDAFTLWSKLQILHDSNKKIGIWFKIVNYLFGVVRDCRIYDRPYEDIIAYIKKEIYKLKIGEIEAEIKTLEAMLKKYNFNEKVKELTNKSAKLLRSKLAQKYRMQNKRKIFNTRALTKLTREFLFEYPVVLSSTHSIRSCLKDVVYDYVIVDESSQVDLATGILAMSCAKNLVVVGDLKQLPNVIGSVEKQITAISDNANIPEEYRYEKNSLLSSVCAIFHQAPRTLLREHYRCHPKIIEYCNKKFYNNQLIIMTEDRGEEDVLKAYITSPGNHGRGNYNQRQIDVVKKEILPNLRSNDIGIIAPYNKQISAMHMQLEDGIEISTVHKFQGREKDDIIISTVDNQITEFTDDPHLINVAVSRAKKRLRLVISDEEKNMNTNMGDLVKYIQYNNFEVKKSDVFSVFDMLYQTYEKSRKSYLSRHKRISIYDSENLMNTIIQDVLSKDEYSKLDVVIHQPLNSIVRNLDILTEKEVMYVTNPLTHLDFLIYNKMDKSPVLALEVDGYSYHKEGTRQSERDKIKNSIFVKCGLPLVRFNTVGSMEKERLELLLDKLI